MAVTHLPRFHIQLHNDLLFPSTAVIIFFRGALARVWQRMVSQVDSLHKESFTNYWLLCVFSEFEGTFSFPDEERDIKQILDGLTKITRIDNKSE